MRRGASAVREGGTIDSNDDADDADVWTVEKGRRMGERGRGTSVRRPESGFSSNDSPGSWAEVSESEDSKYSVF